MDNSNTPGKRVSVEPCVVDGEIARLVDEGDRSYVEVWTADGWRRPERRYPDVSAVLRAPPASREKLIEYGILDGEETKVLEFPGSQIRSQGPGRPEFSDPDSPWWEPPRSVFPIRRHSPWGQLAVALGLTVAMFVWPTVTFWIVAVGILLFFGAGFFFD